MKSFLEFKNCGKVMFADTSTTGQENARKSSNLLNRSNADMRVTEVRPFWNWIKTGDNLVHAAISRLIWTRAYYRTLKLARTIANLDGSDQVLTVRMAEALRYRPKEMRGTD